MEQVYKFDTVKEYNALNNHETLHPLVSVIDFKIQTLVLAWWQIH